MLVYAAAYQIALVGYDGGGGGLAEAATLMRRITYCSTSSSSSQGSSKAGSYCLDGKTCCGDNCCSVSTHPSLQSSIANLLSQASEICITSALTNLPACSGSSSSATSDDTSATPSTTPIYTFSDSPPLLTTSQLLDTSSKSSSFTTWPLYAKILTIAGPILFLALIFLACYILHRIYCSRRPPHDSRSPPQTGTTGNPILFLDPKHPNRVTIIDSYQLPSAGHKHKLSKIDFEAASVVTRPGTTQTRGSTRGSSGWGLNNSFGHPTLHQFQNPFDGDRYTISENRPYTASETGLTHTIGHRGSGVVLRETPRTTTTIVALASAGGGSSAGSEKSPLRRALSNASSRRSSSAHRNKARSLKAKRKTAGPGEGDRSAVADATRILKEMNESKTSLARGKSSCGEKDGFDEKEGERQERSRSVATVASGEKFRERFMELQKELE